MTPVGAHIHSGYMWLISYFGAGLDSQFKVTFVVLGKDILISLLRDHEGSLRHSS